MDGEDIDEINVSLLISFFSYCAYLRRIGHVKTVKWAVKVTHFSIRFVVEPELP